MGEEDAVNGFAEQIEQIGLMSLQRMGCLLPSRWSFVVRRSSVVHHRRHQVPQVEYVTHGA